MINTTYTGHAPIWDLEREYGDPVDKVLTWISKEWKPDGEHAFRAVKKGDNYLTPDGYMREADRNLEQPRIILRRVETEQWIEITFRQSGTECITHYHEWYYSKAIEGPILWNSTAPSQNKYIPLTRTVTYFDPAEEIHDFAWAMGELMKGNPVACGGIILVVDHTVTWHSWIVKHPESVRSKSWRLA